VRALVLSWEYPPLVYGGLGRHVHAVCEGLARAGHAVTVVTQHAPGADYDEVLHGVRVVRVAEDPPLLTLGDDLLAWVLALGHRLTRTALRVAEEGAAAGAPFEVVHAHDWLVAHPATTLKEHLRVPLVATVHATEAGRHQGWLPTALSRTVHTTEWWLTWEARRVITCSAAMREEVRRLFDLPADKVDVIPNGVDARAWVRPRAASPLATGGGPLVVFAGRLEYEKGVHTLLAAVPRLRRCHPGLRVVVAGTGTHAETLRAQSRRLRLGRSLLFAGHLDQPATAALLHAADAAVVPSIYEPFGIVALEAAVAGAPLAVAATGGLRETVESGVTGEVFAAGDPEALADAVSALLGDQVRARRLARAASVRALREHDWDALAVRTAAVWARAVQEERALLAALSAGQVGGVRPPLRVVVGDGNLLGGDAGPA